MAIEVWTLVAETKEWVGPINVTVDSVPVTSFEVSVCEGATRPTVWNAAYADPGGSGSYGVLVGTATWPLAQGKAYTIYVRYTSTPEIPVEKAGKIKTI